MGLFSQLTLLKAVLNDTNSCMCYTGATGWKSRLVSKALTLCTREGNCRSGITLAMCYWLQWSNHLQTQRVGKAEEHSNGVWHPLPSHWVLTACTCYS